VSNPRTKARPWRRLASALLRSLCVAAAAATVVTGVAAATAAESAYFEHEGLRVELDARPLEGAVDQGIRAYEDVELDIRVREANDAGKTVSGLQPLAWLTRREDGEATLEGDACKRHIRGLLAGRLARNADVNLNEYLLITLDDNNSLSIIDPQIESSKTKTLGIVSLASKGDDFVLAPDRRRVLVTLPLKGQVAEADIFERKARYLAVGGQPHRIALQADDRFAWIGDRAGDEVVVVDVDELEVAARFPVGSGPHEFAFAREEPRAFVIGRARSVAIIDTRTLERLGDVSLEAAPVAIGYSDHSRRAYVALDGGRLLVVDGERREVSGTIELPAPVSAFAVSPDGRFGFAVHGEADRVTIVDTASDRIVGTITTGSEPHDIAFSDAFAYIQHAGTGQAVLVDLSVLSSGETPTTAPVALGQRPPVSRTQPTIAPTVVSLPEGGGVLALNGADRSIYHFMEGMNAPMGAYQTYPWRARGVLLSDRTIREVDKGRYATEFQAPSAGEYTLSFLVPTSPQLFGCTQLVVNELPQKPRVARSLKVESLFADRVLAAGVTQSVGLRLTDPDSGEALDELDDVMILVMSGPTWQWRGAARPLGDGRYAVDVTFPRPGQYTVMVASATRGVEFGHTPSAIARVEEVTTDGSGQSSNESEMEVSTR